MSTFNKTLFPTDIATLEQSLVYVIMAAKDTAPAVTAREEGGVVQQCYQWNLKYNDLGQLYFVGRIVVPMAALVDANAQLKPWMRANATPGALPALTPGY